MNPPGGIAKMARASVSEVEDVQAHADTRRLPINRVGIKDIRHPVRVKDRSAGEQHTIASFNMYVSLPHDFKGTHMSRFVEILHAEREISVESFRTMLQEQQQGKPPTGTSGLALSEGPPAWPGFRALRVSQITRESSSISRPKPGTSR